MELNDELTGRCSRIKLLLMDCDGVLTDGRLYFTARGEEMKVFDVKDGQGLALWHKAGFTSGIISGRGSADVLIARANELGIKHVVSSSSDKAADMRRILEHECISADEAVFVGDDVGDLPVMNVAGMSVAVADAVEIVRSKAKYVTSARGGRGAVREVVDMLLSAKSKQDQAVSNPAEANFVSS